MRRLVLLSTMLLVAFTGAVKAGDLTELETKKAKKLYVSKCAKCHKLYDPGKYSDAEWQSWMVKMARKARLKPDQRELLTRFLDGVRAQSMK
ncbi:MAG TPA: hypothetical protein VH598_04530 [Verrucomicrobiae bacterium]|nr:hypothetical protein [Verrucomicrobiae bacterium]